MVVRAARGQVHDRWVPAVGPPGPDRGRRRVRRGGGRQWLLLGSSGSGTARRCLEGELRGTVVGHEGVVEDDPPSSEGEGGRRLRSSVERQLGLQQLDLGVFRREGLAGGGPGGGDLAVEGGDLRLEGGELGATVIKN